MLLLLFKSVQDPFNCWHFWQQHRRNLVLIFLFLNLASWFLDCACSDIEPPCNVSGVKKARCSTTVPCMPVGLASEDKLSAAELILESRRGRERSGTGVNDGSDVEVTTKSENSVQLHAENRERKTICREEPNSCPVDAHSSRPSDVFRQKSFYFSCSFPEEQVTTVNPADFFTEIGSHASRRYGSMIISWLNLCNWFRITSLKLICICWTKNYVEIEFMNLPWNCSMHQFSCSLSFSLCSTCTSIMKPYPC